MTKFRSVSIGVLLCVLFVIRLFSAYAQNDALDAYLEAQVAAQRVPGLALAIAYADGTADVRTYGDGIAPQTRFRIGSLSKAMTAVAVLQLAEQGLVDLDAPVQTYLPGFTTQNPAWASRITVRHLLNQTSGLSERGYNITVARTADELVASFADAQHDAEPGAQFAYFNANYELLGRIVEVVSGQRFSAYLRDNLFTPAGMDDALAFDDPTLTSVDGLAQGHTLLYGFPVPYAELALAPAPSGGVVASGSDMAAFLRQFVIAEPVILKPESVKMMLTAPSGTDSPYGMGWFISTDQDGRRLFTHGGDLTTFHADMALLPDESAAFALLYNRQHFLSIFAAYPQVRDGVIAVLRGGEAPAGGLSASVIGIIILIVSVVIIASDIRQLLASRRWVARTSGQSVLRRALSLALLLIPLYVFLLLPTLIRIIMGQTADYTVLFAQLPDIMLLLVISMTLNVVTVIVRLILWRRAAPAPAPA